METRRQKRLRAERESDDAATQKRSCTTSVEMPTVPVRCEWRALADKTLSTMLTEVNRMFARCPELHKVLETYGWLGYGSLHFRLEPPVGGKKGRTMQTELGIDALHSPRRISVGTALAGTMFSMFQKGQWNKYMVTIRQMVTGLRLMDRYRVHMRLAQTRLRQSSFSSMLLYMDYVHWLFEGGNAIFGGRQGVEHVPDALEPLALPIMTPSPHTALGMMVRHRVGVSWDWAAAEARKYNEIASSMPSTYRGPSIGFCAGRVGRKAVGVFASYPVDCASVNDVQVDMSPFQSRPDPGSFASMFMRNVVPWMRLLLSVATPDAPKHLAVVGYMWYDGMYPCFAYVQNMAEVQRALWEHVMARLVAGPLFSTMFPCPEMDTLHQHMSTPGVSRDALSAWVYATQWMHVSTHETMIRPLCYFEDDLVDHEVRDGNLLLTTLEEARGLMEMSVQNSPDGKERIPTSVLMHLMPSVVLSHNYSRDIRRVVTGTLSLEHFGQLYAGGVRVVTSSPSLHPQHVRVWAQRMQMLNRAWSETWAAARELEQYATIDMKYAVPDDEALYPALRMLQAHRNGDTFMSHVVQDVVTTMKQMVTKGGLVRDDRLFPMHRRFSTVPIHVRNDYNGGGDGGTPMRTHQDDWDVVRQVWRSQMHSLKKPVGLQQQRNTSLSTMESMLFSLHVEGTESRTVMTDEMDTGLYREAMARIMDSVRRVSMTACDTQNAGRVCADSVYWASSATNQGRSRFLSRKTRLDFLTFATHVLTATQEGELTSAHPLLWGRVPNWNDEMQAWSSALMEAGPRAVPRADQEKSVLTLAEPDRVAYLIDGIDEADRSKNLCWEHIGVSGDSGVRHAPLIVRSKTYGGLVHAPMNAAASEMDERARLYLLSLMARYDHNPYYAFGKSANDVREMRACPNDMGLLHVLSTSAHVPGTLGNQRDYRYGRNFIASALQAWQLADLRFPLQWSLLDVPAWMLRAHGAVTSAMRMREITHVLQRMGPDVLPLAIDLIRQGGRCQEATPESLQVIRSILTALALCRPERLESVVRFQNPVAALASGEFRRIACMVGDLPIRDQLVDMGLDGTANVRRMFHNLFHASGAHGTVICVEMAREWQGVLDTDTPLFTIRSQLCFNTVHLYYNPFMLAKATNDHILLSLLETLQACAGERGRAQLVDETNEHVFRMS